MSRNIFLTKNKNSPASLDYGMNRKIHVTSVVGGETVSPTDRKLSPAGRNTGIQPLHKKYRLWIKTIAEHLTRPRLQRVFFYEVKVIQKKCFFVGSIILIMSYKIRRMN